MIATMEIRVWEVSLYTVCSADLLAWAVSSAHWDQRRKDTLQAKPVCPGLPVSSANSLAWVVGRAH